MNGKLSRRFFLKGSAGAAGAIAASRLTGTGFMRDAHAQAAPGEKPCLVLLHLDGGFNSLFVSSDGLDGQFSCSANSTRQLGELGLDRQFADAFDATLRPTMAAVGVRHGISDHGNAQNSLWTNANRNAATLLADSMGGDASIKFASVGQMTYGSGAAVGTTSRQQVNDFAAAIAALGPSTDPTIPDRLVGAAALTQVDKMNANFYARSGGSLGTVKDGVNTAVSTLKKPITPFNYDTIANAYGINPNQKAVQENNFRTKCIGAELMILQGANVISLRTNGWDSHGDRSGNGVRGKMMNEILPGLTVLARRMSDPATSGNVARNVVISIIGDFARSLPGSDHQPNMSAFVMGKYLKNATSGKTNNNVALPGGTPSIPGLWGLYAAALKQPAAVVQTFGGNPHAMLLK